MISNSYVYVWVHKVKSMQIRTMDGFYIKNIRKNLNKAEQMIADRIDEYGEIVGGEDIEFH